MERLIAIDAIELNASDATFDVVLERATLQDPYSVTVTSTPRAQLSPRFESAQHNPRRRTLQIVKRAGADAETVNRLVHHIFSPFLGARTLTYLPDAGKEEETYTAEVRILSFGRVTPTQWTATLEFADPRWHSTVLTTATTSPITLQNSNAIVKPTITITNGLDAARERLTYTDRTGHGVAGYLTSATTSSAAEHTFVYLNGIEIPFAVNAGRVYFRIDVPPSPKHTFVDIVTSEHLTNTTSANALNAAGITLDSGVASGIYKPNPATLQSNPAHSSFSWVPARVGEHPSSRDYDFGFDGTTLKLNDQDAGGTPQMLANTADAFVLNSPVELATISNLNLELFVGYDEGASQYLEETASGEKVRVMRVTISDLDGGFPSLPTNPDFYQHPDSRHPDVPYYAQFTFGDMTFPNTRAVNNQRTPDLDGDGNVVGSFEGWEPVGGTFMRRNEWIDDYLPQELPELAERFIECTVTQGEEGVYYLRFPEDAFRGIDLPLLSMTLQPKTGEFIQASIIEPLRTVISIDDIGEETTEPVILYEAVWVDPNTLEPLEDVDDAPPRQGAAEVFVAKQSRSSSTWETVWSKRYTSEPGGSTHTIALAELSLSGATGVAIGLRPAARASQIEWGELRFTSTPTITLGSTTPLVTKTSIEGQIIHGQLLNETTGRKLIFDQVYTDASGLEIDTDKLTIQAVGEIYGSLRATGGVLLFDLGLPETVWSQTFEGDVEFSYREALAV